MKRRGVALRIAAGLAASSPLACDAHLITTGLGPVYDGISHLALTPEDLIPTLALALLAALRGKDHARAVILALPVAWLAAGIAGILIGAGAFVSPSWAPLLILGGLVAADRRMRIGATIAIAILLGAWLGCSNGTAMAAGPGWRGVAGVSMTAFVVVTLVAAVVTVWQAGWLRIVWRVAGSWIAASGLLLLGWSLV